MPARAPSRTGIALRFCPVKEAERMVPPEDYDLMVFEAASHVTGFWRKYDSFAIWQATAALFPNTASSVTGLRDFTAWKNTFRCGFISSQSCPLLTGSSFYSSF